MKKKRMLCLLAVAGVVGFSGLCQTSSAFANYQVSISSIDDKGECYINGSLIKTVEFGDGNSGWIDISNYLTRENNDVMFRASDNNNGRCYSYKFQIQKDHEIIYDQYSTCCSPSCALNSMVVFEDTITIPKYNNTSSDCDDGYTEADLNTAREEARQECIADPTSCGIEIGSGYNEGYEVGYSAGLADEGNAASYDIWSTILTIPNVMVGDDSYSVELEGPYNIINARPNNSSVPEPEPEEESSAPSCDSNNLELCSSSECSSAGGYWYDDACNVNEPVNNEDSSSGTISIPTGEAIVVTWKNDYDRWKGCGPAQKLSTSYAYEDEAIELTFTTGTVAFLGTVGKFRVYSLNRPLLSYEYDARRCLN